ncbi:MAG: hypothetical protein KA035_03110 [Candidatus Levybacteria bacterium]|nr:hypothetical protein [Candidatus Levybacteria bacterium]
MSKEISRPTYSRRRFVKDAILLAGVATASFAGLQCMQNEKQSQSREKKTPQATPTSVVPVNTPQTW